MTPISNSRSTSFRLVRRSVESLRWPTIRAHCQPVRACRVVTLADAGEDDGARRHVAAVLERLAPVTPMIGIDPPSTTPGAICASADAHALDDDRAGADERAVLHDQPGSLRRLQHAADADAPERWTSAPICAHDPTVAHVSTIVRGPTHAPMLTYAGMRTPSERKYEP